MDEKVPNLRLTHPKWVTSLWNNNLGGLHLFTVEIQYSQPARYGHAEWESHEGQQDTPISKIMIDDCKKQLISLLTLLIEVWSAIH